MNFVASLYSKGIREYSGKSERMAEIKLEADESSFREQRETGRKG